MARGRREAQLIEVDPNDDLEPAAESPLDTNVERFLVERADGISDAVVKVYKAASQAVPGKSGQLRDAWLYSVPPDEFAEDFLQANYGAGAFRIKMYGTAQGKYCMLVNRIIEIGAAPPSLKKDLPALAGMGGVNVNVPGGGAAELAKAIAEANAPIFAMLAELVKAQQGGGRKAILEEMQIMAAMLKPAADNKTSLMDAIALAEKISGLSKGGENVDGESGPWLVLKEAVSQLGPSVAAMIEAKRNGATVAALPLPAQAGAPETQTVTAQNSEGEAMILALRMQLGFILNAARGGADEETYAQLIYDQAPDEVIEKLQAEKWFEELCALEPQFSAVKPWTEKVRAHVMDMLKEDADEQAAVAVSAAEPPAKETAKPKA